MNQQQSSQSATTASHKRRVTMNPNVSVVETLNLDDYTPKEIAAAWYDEQEFDQITQKCFRILQRMEAGQGQKYCTRGLEGHSTLGSISKKKARSASFVAVLEEQERQWSENIEIDVQAISDAYQTTTSSCQMWAQVVGNRDQQAVESYLYPDDEEEEDDEQIDLITAAVECSPLSPTSEREKQVVAKKAGLLQSCARAA